MQCRSPRYLGFKDMIVSCGRCYPCKVNRMRVWQTRIMLEADAHEHNSFVTLTYDNAHLPTIATSNGTVRGNLYPRDLQLFFKRLRRRLDFKIRFYAVGEYGDKTWRPHYHVCLFGLGIVHTYLIEKAWGKGLIHVGSLTSQSAGYVAGYIEKKMTNPKDKRLFGRYPEFARSSNRFGIGFNYVDKLVDYLMPFKGDIKDVPNVVRLFGKLMPLGRYIRSKVRLRLWGHECAPPSILDKAKEELLLLKQQFRETASYFYNFSWEFTLFLRGLYCNSGVAQEQTSMLYRLNKRSL